MSPSMIHLSHKFTKGWLISSLWRTSYKDTARRIQKVEVLPICSKCLSIITKNKMILRNLNEGGNQINYVVEKIKMENEFLF